MNERILMFKPKAAFSGFSVNNMDQAKIFYTTVLGLKVRDDVGGSKLDLPGGTQCWMYAKDDHQPATYTILNFVVDDVDEAVDELISRGVSFEKYEGAPQDEKGIMRGKDYKMGPSIAWFKDPAGNILSVLEPD
jgi:catechol 2,3-dioxygenase-like lactoylglutathione lyase family enzyme